MARKTTHKASRSIRQLTLRGFGPELEARLRRAAEAENLSLNQAALRFMERGAGLAERRAKLDTIGDALDEYIGTWTKKQAEEVLGAVRDFERTDAEFWK
jgi:hypothetical protein